MAKDVIDLEILIEDLLASEEQQSNCMLHLSLMVARLALSSVSEDFKDHASQIMLELVRAKRQDAPVIKHSRFDPEQRKPWIVDVHSSPVSQMPSPTPVSALFGSGGLS